MPHRAGAALQERAKELACLYEVEECLSNPEAPLDMVFRAVIEALPPGWQYPELCEAKIEYGDATFTSEGYVETPWSRAAFRYEITQNRVARCLVVRGRLPEQGRREGDPAWGGAPPAVLGYLCLWEIGHEIHITNLAVHPAHRRQGLARALLGPLLEDARARGVILAFLEVRPTNREALALYESLGFRLIGRRKNYYFDTGEDALVMEARLSATPQ